MVTKIEKFQECLSHASHAHGFIFSLLGLLALKRYDFPLKLQTLNYLKDYCEAIL
jgi:hypothetical protein